MLSPEMLGLDGGINVFEIYYDPKVDTTKKGEELLEIFNPETDVAPEYVEFIINEGYNANLESTDHTFTVKFEREMAKLGRAVLLPCVPDMGVEILKRIKRPEFLGLLEEDKIPKDGRMVSYYFWLMHLYEDDFDRLVGWEEAQRYCRKWFDKKSQEPVIGQFQYEALIYRLSLATLIVGKPLLNPDSDFANNLRQSIAHGIKDGSLWTRETSRIIQTIPIIIELFAQGILFPNDFAKNNLKDIYKRNGINSYLSQGDLECLFFHSVLCGSIKFGREEEELEPETFPDIPAVRRF